MPNAGTLKRSLNAAQLALTPSNATTGAWTSQLSGNIYTFHKAAAATTSVVNLPIPAGNAGRDQDDFQVAKIEVYYSVLTANLTSAPTAVLNKQTTPSTGTVARAAVTQTLTFAGLDAVGTAIGDHIAVITITTPAQFTDQESLVLALTMNEAATSVLDINGITVTYQGRY